MILILAVHEQVVKLNFAEAYFCFDAIEVERTDGNLFGIWQNVVWWLTISQLGTNVTFIWMNIQLGQDMSELARNMMAIRRQKLTTDVSVGEVVDIGQRVGVDAIEGVDGVN